MMIFNVKIVIIIYYNVVLKAKELKVKFNVKIVMIKIV